MSKKSFPVVLCVGILFGLSVPGALAQQPFFQGKTVRIIVGFTPGGGYDTYARLIARHLGKHLPGNPTVVVDNMPGAGSLSSANHLYNLARQDGSVIGTFSRILSAAYSCSSFLADPVSNSTRPNSRTWECRCRMTS